MLFWSGVYVSVQFSSISFIFKSDQVGARTLQMTVPYPRPNVESYTQTPSHHHSCSAGRAKTTSLRSDDLVVPNLPAWGCEWWRRLVFPSIRGDWWATCHDESCAQYSRLQCVIRLSPLLPPPLEVAGSVYTAFLTATHEIRQPAVVSGSASKRARRGWGAGHPQGEGWSVIGGSSVWGGHSFGLVVIKSVDEFSLSWCFIVAGSVLLS